MQNSAIIRTFEKYIIPMASVIGISVIYLLKIGEYLYYQVPVELIELSPISTILRGLLIGFMLSSAAYSVTSITDGISIKNERIRYFIYLICGFFLTGALFLKYLNIHDNINWPAILFVLVLSSMAYSIDRYARRLLIGVDKNDSFKSQLSSFSIHMFLFIVLVSSVAVAFGYSEAKKDESRLYLKDTELVYIGRSGGLMIFKRYDPAKKMYDPEETFLISPGEKTVLTSKPTKIFAAKM